MTKVLVYSLPTCEWCKKTKAFLKDNNISFEDISIDNKDDVLKEMINKSGQTGVPVIDIDGEIVIGFNEKKISELLKL